MGKLIDADDIQFQPSKTGMRSFDYVCRVSIDSMPGIDVESLDEVKRIKRENERLVAQINKMKRGG